MIKRQDIQVLRGLSVAAIVIFHLNLSYLPKGYLGVDVFFVISGFVVTPLITRSIEGSIKQKSLLPLFNFYLRRFLRLAPALLSTLTVFFLPLMIFSKVDDIGTISNQALFTLFGLGNVGAYLNSGNYFSSNVNPLIHTWSLGVEEQIYLFVPVALFFVYLAFRFRGSFRSTLFFLGSLSFIGSELTSFFLHLYEKLGLSFVEDFSFYSPLNRLWQFALGGVLALTIQKSGRISNYAIGGVSLSIFVMVLFLPALSAGTSSILISIATALILHTRILNRNLGQFGFVFGWLGDRSYSIYLIHMPVMYWAHLAGSPESLALRFLEQFLTLFVIILMGSFQFKLVEQRMRLQTRTENAFSTMGIILICLSLSLFCFAAYSAGKHLASNRLSPIIPSILTASTEDTHILRTSQCVDIDFDPAKCTWGNPYAEKSIVLVGDSQAYALADGLVKSALELDIKVTVGSVSGCPFLGLQTSGRMIVDCAKFKRDVWRYLENTRPNIVIVANRTSGYAQPYSGWRTFLDLSGNPITSTEMAQKAYSQSLAQMAIKLTKQTNLVIFQNIPEPENIGSPPTVWSYILNKSAYDGSTDSKVFVDHDVRSIEKKLSDQFNFTLFDPVRVMCVNECSDGINVGADYMDSWHLSTLGSEKLSSRLTTALQNVLGLSSMAKSN